MINKIRIIVKIIFGCSVAFVVVAYLSLAGNAALGQDGETCGWTGLMYKDKPVTKYCIYTCPMYDRSNTYYLSKPTPFDKCINIVPKQEIEQQGIKK